MATVLSAYPQHMYHQGSYHYPMMPSTYSLQAGFNNYFIPQQPQTQMYQQPIPQSQPQTKLKPTQKHTHTHTHTDTHTHTKKHTHTTKTHKR